MITFICSKHGEYCPPFCEELLDAAEIKIPLWAICPISLDVMKHPVVDQYGHSYEQVMLEKHFQLFDRSPLTNAPYTMNQWFMTNYGLKHAITELWTNAVKKVKQVWPNTPLPRRPPPYVQERATNAPPNTPTTPTPPSTRLVYHRRNLPTIDTRNVHFVSETDDDDYTTEDAEL
jgi:hypothetical protein